jgi:hypothetical protein
LEYSTTTSLSTTRGCLLRMSAYLSFRSRLKPFRTEPQLGAELATDTSSSALSDLVTLRTLGVSFDLEWIL